MVLVLVGLWYLRSREAAPVVGPTSSRTEAPSPDIENARRTPADAPSEDRYDLEADEARGGHTLARHVGRTDAQLRDRLAGERGISTASTYTTRELAERTVARTLRANADRVRSWTARRGSRPNLALDYHGPRGEVLGRSIRRGRAPVDCTDAVIVLRWDGRGSYVLTSYPESSR